MNEPFLENGVIGNFDPGDSMLTPQTNFHFSEPRKLKSPKNQQNRMSSPKTPKIRAKNPQLTQNQLLATKK
jgi:hypothetical protein